MNHVQAGLLWLVNTFNQLWPLALASFVGATAALGYQGLKDRRQYLNRVVEEGGAVVAILRAQIQELSRAHEKILQPWLDGRKRLALIPGGWTIRPPALDSTRVASIFLSIPEISQALLVWQQQVSEIGAMCTRRLQLESLLFDLGSSVSAELQSQQEHLERLLKNVTEQIYTLVVNSVREGDMLAARATEAWTALRQSQPRTGLEILPWSFLAMSSVLSGGFFFSEWAVGDTSMVDVGVDLQTMSVVLFAALLYASLAFCCVCGVFMVRAAFKKEKTLAIYFAALTIGVQPLLYLMWLQASSA